MKTTESLLPMVRKKSSCVVEPCNCRPRMNTSSAESSLKSLLESECLNSAVS